MTQHTPGPWEVAIIQAGKTTTILSAGPARLTALTSKPDRVATRFADAKLIAAAPELLESLKELAFIVESVAHLQGRERELLPSADKARAAIARATGE